MVCPGKQGTVAPGRSLLMMKFRAAILVALSCAVAPFLSGQTYSTGFESPGFTLGDVNGQNGWGHLSNSPTDGFIEAIPAGSPAALGAQALAIRTRNVAFFG